MTIINPEFIEKYQLILESTPQSKVFAPLAEAYRKLGLFKEAQQVCQRGIRANPNFASGRVAYAQLLLEQENFQLAHDEINKAIELAPENILAHNLHAEILLRLKQPKEALKAFKMLLFLNPNHSKAQKAVKKLESLTADEYDDDTFSLQKLNPSLQLNNVDLKAGSFDEIKDKHPELTLAHKERHLSLIDAFLARNDLDKAQSSIERTKEKFGNFNELQKRQKLINRDFEPKTKLSSDIAANVALSVKINLKKQKKIKKLEHFLKNINFKEKFD